MALLVCSAESEILPAGRRATWNPGVAGGIPERSTIFTNLSSGGGSEIAAAIAACPSNQVVKLGSGEFVITNTLTLMPVWAGGVATRNGVTLRGSGTNTILRLTNNGNIYIRGENVWSPIPTNIVRDWTSGYSQGLSNITIVSTGTNIYDSAALRVGSILVLDQINDPSVVNIVSKDGSWATNSSGIRDSGTRAQRQATMVTGVSAETNITFTPPIAMTNWSASRTPQSYFIGNPASRYSIENMTIDASGSSWGSVIYIHSATECWISGVRFYKASSHSVDFTAAVNCALVDSDFVEAQSYGSGNYGITISVSSGVLVQNCAFDYISSPVLLNGGTTGNVIAYNYCTTNGVYYSVTNSWLPPSFDSHYVHSCMDLFEGNVGNSLTLDFTHGSGSHVTALRNRLTGRDKSTQTQNTFPINIQATNRYANLVGNVLGTAGYHTNYYIDATSLHLGGSPKTILKFGYIDDSGDTNNADAMVMTSALVHGNYDTVSVGQTWDSGIADHAIPDSYYLSGKPAWFGNMTWPPINPSSPDLSDVPLIPAHARWIGSNYMSSDVSSSITIGTATIGTLRTP